MIVKQHGSVRGITTAASVWVAAAIGLSAGLGFWAGAISATLVAVVALYALKPVSRLIGERSKQRELVVSLSPTSGVLLDDRHLDGDPGVWADPTSQHRCRATR